MVQEYLILDQFVVLASHPAFPVMYLYLLRRSCHLVLFWNMVRNLWMIHHCHLLILWMVVCRIMTVPLFYHLPKPIFLSVAWQLVVVVDVNFHLPFVLAISPPGVNVAPLEFQWQPSVLLEHAPNPETKHPCVLQERIGKI